MKCKKLFALLLSLCMIASSFVAVSVAADTENVIDINLPLDDASELTWVQSGVTVSNANEIGGRSNVVKAEGLANSNNNTVGVVLANNFKFLPGDVLTYSVDVYSETALNPDLWLRNHGSSLEPFTTFYSTNIAANTWTTVTKTVAYEDFGGTGSWTTEGKYALYLRPRQNATVYLDNFVVTLSREVAGDDNDEPTSGKVIDINATDASGFTMLGADVSVTGGQSIGGRDGVVKATGVANSNNGIVGVKLPDGFAFEADDIITYSVDVYSETANYKPDIYIRDHSDWNPMAVVYGKPTAANEWITVTKTLTVAELDAIVPTVNSTGTFATAGNYAFYVRPRDTSVLYLDNFVVTVEREGAETPTPTPDVPTPTPDAPTPTPTPDATEGEKIVDLTAEDAAGFTMLGANVSVTGGQSIGGRDGVVKAENVKNTNDNVVGIKLPDGFAFQAGDVITYSVDVYSETAINPDIWVRNHNGSVLNPMAVFYSQTMPTATWQTVTKTVTFDELEALIGTSNSTGTFATAGNYAVYLRPRTTGETVVYLDNFKVTVVGAPRSEGGGEDEEDPDAPAPSTNLEVKGYLDKDTITVQQKSLNYTFADGTFKVDVKELAIYNNGQNLQGNSFVRAIPETPINVNNKFKITFNVETAGIADATSLTVSARLFDDTKSSGTPNTIGWLRSEVKINVEGGVTVVLDNTAGLTETGGSKLDKIASFGIGLDVQKIADANNSAEDAFIKISDVKLEYIAEIVNCEIAGTTTDSVTLDLEFESAVVEDSIKNACVINGTKWNPDLITVVVDEENSKKATVTILGLASSTEYELTLSDTVTPTTTKTFTTLDAAAVEASINGDTVTYSIVNNASATTKIYAVLLRCKGNTVIESKVISPEGDGCASGAAISGTINAGTIDEGEYVKFFAWTFDDGKVNSLAPSQIFE